MGINDIDLDIYLTREELEKLGISSSFPIYLPTLKEAIEFINKFNDFKYILNFVERENGQYIFINKINFNENTEDNYISIIDEYYISITLYPDFKEYILDYIKLN